MRQNISELLKIRKSAGSASNLHCQTAEPRTGSCSAADDFRQARCFFKTLCLLPAGGMFLSMWLCILFFLTRTDDRSLLLSMGLSLSLLALGWTLFLLNRLAGQFADFTADLCRTIDRMAEGRACPEVRSDKETLLSRIHSRLLRLYEIMEKQRNAAENEHQKLQQLITDISHQVKTPVSNLKLVTDTLLTRPVTSEERNGFLEGLKTQTEQLHFLFQTLLKTSRLETGAILLKKNSVSLYETVAQAMGGIFCQAQQKHLTVTADCPENLCLPHDGKWTAEALFNLLDNAVKYTPEGGSIHVSAELWEMYAKIDITDTGIGIPESSHAAVFRRFYREASVHDIPGIGIGLFLAREIITLQGGYIMVRSAPGKGSTFSVFLPRHF